MRNQVSLGDIHLNSMSKTNHVAIALQAQLAGVKTDIASTVDYSKKLEKWTAENAAKLALLHEQETQFSEAIEKHGK